MFSFIFQVGILHVDLRGPSIPRVMHVVEKEKGRSSFEAIIRDVGLKRKQKIISFTSMLTLQDYTGVSGIHNQFPLLLEKICKWKGLKLSKCFLNIMISRLGCWMLTYLGQVPKNDECWWKRCTSVFHWVSYKLNRYIIFWSHNQELPS